MFAAPLKIPSRKRKLEVEEHEELKLAVLAFEKAILRNQEERSRFLSTPSRFMDSEIHLHSCIVGLYPIATSLSFIPKLIELETHLSLLTLLAHQNSDVIAAVLGLFCDLLDATGFFEGPFVKQLLSSVIENDGIEMMVEALGHLNAFEKEDRVVFLKSLALFEGLVDVHPPTSSHLASAGIFKLLLDRVISSEGDIALDSSELLSILVQAGGNSVCILFLTNGHLETLLNVVHGLITKKSKRSLEEEMLENVLNCLEALLILEEGCNAFEKNEGLQLCQRMIRHKSTRKKAFGILSLFIGGSVPHCESFVEIGGLKTLFAVLMKDMEDIDVYESLFFCLMQLFLYLSGGKYQRLILKFAERGFEKANRIISIRFFLPESDTLAIELCDIIIVFLVTSEYSGLKEHTLEACIKHKLTVSVLTDSLQHFHDSLENSIARNFQKKVIAGLLSMMQNLFD